jgi:transcriptional regulator with XRE-family HTH domain
MNIAANIKRIREERGMTQQQIATLIGMHRSNYSKIEKGQRDISVAAVVKIANHFEITVDELLNLNNKLPDNSTKALPNLNDLSDEDKSTVYRLIDLLSSEKKFKELLDKDKK